MGYISRGICPTSHAMNATSLSLSYSLITVCNHIWRATHWSQRDCQKWYHRTRL